MSYSQVCAAVKSVLESVPGVGAVYDYLRWTTDPVAYQSLFASGGEVRFWTISRASVQDVRRYTEQVDEVHTVVLRGYLALDDASASEKSFQDLVDSVRAALREDYTLGGVACNSGPEMHTTIEHRQFGEVLCHYCEISFPVRERKDRTAG